MEQLGTSEELHECYIDQPWEEIDMVQKIFVERMILQVSLISEYSKLNSSLNKNEAAQKWIWLNAGAFSDFWETGNRNLPFQKIQEKLDEYNLNKHVHWTSGRAENIIEWK